MKTDFVDGSKNRLLEPADTTSRAFLATPGEKSLLVLKTCEHPQPAALPYCDSQSNQESEAHIELTFD